MVGSESRFSGGSDRVLRPSHGVDGGLDGIAGCVIINPGTDTEQYFKGLISNVAIEEGDVLRVETGSAGGVGLPKERDRERVVLDLQNGFITPEAAKATYGLSDEMVEKALKGTG